MVLDFILIKENSTELIVTGIYNNDFEFFADKIQIFPDKVNKIWKLNESTQLYEKNSCRIVINKNFSLLKIVVSNCEINYESLKNLHRGKYEYHRYKMYLDENNIYVHKTHFVRRR